MEDELELDPEQIGGGEGAGTPPPEPGAAAAEPAKPAFELAIDDRTKYTDIDQAKKGFTELKSDRDRHKTQAETLAEENRRLKLALTGGADDGKPKSALTPEAKAKQLAWLQSVKPDLGILTLEDLKRPEVQAEMRAIIQEHEQEQLVKRGETHVAQALKAHGIEMSPVRQRAFMDYLGGVIRDDESAELRNRFLAGDMKVLDELIEEHFAAHIAARRATQEADEAKQQAERDRRGRFAKVEEAKGRMKNLPAGPPKGGGAAVANAPNEVPKTPADRRKRMSEVLDRLAS